MLDCAEVKLEVVGRLGCISLNRTKALNALSLPMIRSLGKALNDWAICSTVDAVALRGISKSGPFGNFCVGGDIRFFYEAAQIGNPELEDFFTEEYELNHLIHNYRKPIIAFMDGIVIGGGMGLTQGASYRIVTEKSRLSMPETLIGLFPDVGGGFFLSKLENDLGRYLALTGDQVLAKEALNIGWADFFISSELMPTIWEDLSTLKSITPEAIKKNLTLLPSPQLEQPSFKIELITKHFSKNSIKEIIHSLESEQSTWAIDVASKLRKRSPLMLHVVFEQIKRAKGMSLSDELRMERDMVRHCFHSHHLNRFGPQTETVEGIRAMVIDKDHKPSWYPSRIEDVNPEMINQFFESPWPSFSHPLRDLIG